MAASSRRSAVPARSGRIIGSRWSRGGRCRLATAAEVQRTAAAQERTWSEVPEADHPSNTMKTVADVNRTIDIKTVKHGHPRIM